MHKSRLFFVISIIASASLVSFCGETAEYAGVNTDAGSDAGPGGGVECFTASDCVTGDCIDGACVHCSETGCEPGQACGIDGKCFACDDCDAGVIPNPDDGGTGGCVVREDCPAGQVCKDQVCTAPDPSGDCGSTEECPAGNICRFGQCKPGCEDNSDCIGNSNGPRCDAATEQCVPCIDSGDCFDGDLCVNGACVPPDGCTDRSTCGDLACISGRCAPCTSAGDCGANFDCDAGRCIDVGGCSNDTECQVFSPGHWCNPSNRQCEWGCLPGVSPSCGQNCCPSGQVCNTTTRACETGTTNPGCNNCDNLCGPGLVCNQTTCQCEASGGGLPGFMEACGRSCECDTGLQCMCLSGNCSSFECFIGAGLCM